MSIFGDVIFGTGQQQKIMPLRRRWFPFVASFTRCGPTSSKAGEYAVVLTATPSARRASHDRDCKSDISRRERCLAMLGYATLPCMKAKDALISEL